VINVSREGGRIGRRKKKGVGEKDFSYCIINARHACDQTSLLTYLNIFISSCELKILYVNRIEI
jgi:hypothetical protein